MSDKQTTVTLNENQTVEYLKMTSKRIGGIDVEMLAGAALGWSIEKTEQFINGYGDWDEVLYDAFEIEFEQFGKIADALIMLTPVTESPLSKNLYHAFVCKCKGGYMAIAKVPVVE